MTDIRASRTSIVQVGSVYSLGSMKDGISSSWLNMNQDLALPDSKLAEKRNLEIKYLETARELYKSEKVDCMNDLELLKFLKANDHHVGKALGALSDSLTWRNTYKVHGILEEDFQDLDDTGMAQFIGKTRIGVPILVLNNSRHKSPKDAAGRERMVRYGIYLIERAKSEGVLVDKLTVILDRFNTTTAQMDTHTFKVLIPLLQKNYPETLAKFIVFPNTTMFWMAWKLMKGSIDSVTLKKIDIRDNPDTLIGMIDREHLMERYGGLVKDMYDTVPSDPHIHEQHQQQPQQHAETVGPDLLLSSETAESDTLIESKVEPELDAPELTQESPIASEPSSDALEPIEQVESSGGGPPKKDSIPELNAETAAVTTQTSDAKKPYKLGFSWKGWNSSSSAGSSPTKSAAGDNTPPVSPDKMLPPAASVAVTAVTAVPVVVKKPSSMAVPPLCPLTVEVLFCAPDFDNEDLLELNIAPVQAEQGQAEAVSSAEGTVEAGISAVECDSN
ncbi:CRAL-TRIO domain-containing protein [Chytriomyces cf. hyalinus JEL632]|nr:CRAL-TRIO domain-containing protein [Chytriomyces cf. hyalinus JEL632]